MDLPKDSRSQRKYIETFSQRRYTDLSQAKKGDLLFFMDYKGWRETDYKGINVRAQRTSHVGIYMGNGKMLHTASKATGGVRIDNVFGKHYQYRFQGGGSVLP
jgi:cell wall-associated NlpC family hydrolase